MEHYRYFGKAEGRLPCDSFHASRARKIERITPLLKLEMPHQRRGIKYDFLTDDLRQQTGITSTDNVSSNDYDGYGMALIEQFNNGLILDCGAGKRKVYYDNVVNYEIVDYDTTDIIGVGEALPFKDASFEAVISVAVLEHVRDPFACAAELVRVLKPGGKLLCCVPFLQPLHGYPNHYFNMTHQGLRALFERSLEIDDQLVIDSILPIWSLTWILQSWAQGLSGGTKTKFMKLRISDLMGSPLEYLNAAWVRGLSPEKNLELASATLLTAHKPRQETG